MTLETPYAGSYIFTPNDGEPHPGIMLLHGSEGALHSTCKSLGPLLAAHGYTAFAFCYFGMGDCFIGPRETLARYELLHTYEAFRWLKSSRFVDGRKAGIYGVSRGAEHAMLLSSLVAKDDGLDLPDCVALHAPSEIVYGAWNWDWNDSRCWLADPSKPSGKIWNPACGLDPTLLSPEQKVAWLWKNHPIVPETRIEFERYRGPSFICHGEADTVWTVENSHRIESALKASGLLPECHYFPGENHQLKCAAENQRNDLLLRFFAKHLI